jgi:hypothetical protein
MTLVTDQRVSAFRRRTRKCDGRFHFRRIHLRGALEAERHRALGMDAVGLGPAGRRASPAVCEREAGEVHSRMWRMCRHP